VETRAISQMLRTKELFYTITFLICGFTLNQKGTNYPQNQQQNQPVEQDVFSAI